MVSASPTTALGGGLLTQGSTGPAPNFDDANLQYYEIPNLDFDFDHDVIEVEVDLRIIESTKGTTTGFGIQVVDADFEQVFLYVAENGFWVTGDGIGVAPSVHNTTLAVRTYTLRIDPAFATASSDGVEEGFIGRVSFSSHITPNVVRIGDLSDEERSSSEIQAIRFRRFNPAVAEVRNLEWIREESPTALHTSIFQSASCTGGRKVISGGARIIGGDGNVLLNRSVGEVGDRWRGGAIAAAPTVPWSLQVDVICGELPGRLRTGISSTPFGGDHSFTEYCPFSRTAVAGGFASGESDAAPYRLDFNDVLDPLGFETAIFDESAPYSVLISEVTCSTARDFLIVRDFSSFDSESPKGALAICPGGSMAVGGGAMVSGGATNEEDFRLLASYPDTLSASYPGFWVARFEERVPVAESWQVWVTAICAPLAEATTPKHGLVGRWNADTGFPLDERDDHVGVLVNGASIDPGIAAQAFTFEAQNLEWMRIDQPYPDDPFYPGSESFSVDLFFQAVETSPAGVTALASLRDEGGTETLANASLWAVRLLDGGELHGHISPFTGTFDQLVQGSEDLRDGEIHHAALVRDMEERVVSLYVDGVLVDEEAVQGVNQELKPGAPLTPDPVSVGVFRDSGASTVSQAFDGQIDDIKYYDRALSADEIRNVAGCEVPVFPRVLNLDASRFSSLGGNPIGDRLCVLLPAGTWRFDLVNPSLDPDARFTAWDASGAWFTTWTAQTEGQTAGFGGGAGNGSWLTPEQAFDETPLSDKSEIVTVATDEKFYFYLPAGTADQRGGGVSIRVPEPSAAVQVVSGVLMLLAMARRGHTSRQN